MRTRTQEATPEPSQAASPVSKGVACPECFQEGEHLDGCPHKGTTPEQAAPPAERAPPSPSTTQESAQPTQVTRNYPSTGDETGQMVSCTWGEEHIQPVQFNHFKIGPLSATTIVRKGETTALALLRLHTELAFAAKAIADTKLNAYIATLNGAIDAGKRHAR